MEDVCLCLEYKNKFVLLWVGNKLFQVSRVRKPRGEGRDSSSEKLAAECPAASSPSTVDRRRLYAR